MHGRPFPSWGSHNIQGEIAEAWKDNLLDELAKRESEVELVEQLFTKIRNNFGEISEEERKIEQLRTIEQESSGLKEWTEDNDDEIGNICNPYYEL